VPNIGLLAQKATTDGRATLLAVCNSVIPERPVCNGGRPQGPYLLAIPLAFVSPWIASGLFVFAALLWLVPGRRIERMLVKREKEWAFSCLTARSGQ
jgi:hypothetical protein